MKKNAQYLALIAHVVESKLAELDGVEVGVKTGRQLQAPGVDENGAALSPAEMRNALGELFTDVGQRAGLEVLFETPAVLLEQFCVMAQANKHDAAQLLNIIRSSFLVAYLTPETNERAYQHLEGIDALREELISQRSVAGMTMQ